jgi:hypothetical protein
MTPKFADRGKRRLHLFGAIACLLAIFLSAGGHWALLQSFAYTRMLLEFSQQDSWCTAMQKTFDERYACPLCPKIRDGYNKQHNTPMSLEGVHQPEFLVQSKGLVFFTPDLGTEIAFVLPRHIDFLKAPPKPPPRVA